MSHQMIGAIGSIAMLVLLFTGIDIAVILAAVGVIGYMAIQGVDRTLSMVAMTPFDVICSYNMALFPIYLLLGEFADLSGMMAESFRAARIWVGQLRGGLAMASVVGGAFLAAVSGSSTACTALLTKLSLPSLLENNYSPRLACGALSAAGTLSNLIPPSIGLVLYAVMTETSLGALFIATMVPGILLTLMFMLQIYLQCLYDPTQGPATAKTSLKEKLLAFKYALPVIVLFSVVMGGIWFGVYTANEAGSIGCGLACLYAIYKKKVNKESLKNTFGSALKIVGIIFAIIIGAELFSNFIVVSGVSLAIAQWVAGLHLSPTGVVIVIMLIYFVLGTALDTLAMILVTLPFFVPVLNALHIDMVWFGILVVIQMELSQITPPVGLNLFVVAGMVKERGISMGTVFSGAWPFCYTMLIYNALVVFFPQIAMYLPRLMK